MSRHGVCTRIILRFGRYGFAKREVFRVYGLGSGCDCGRGFGSCQLRLWRFVCWSLKIGVDRASSRAEKFEGVDVAAVGDVEVAGPAWVVGDIVVVVVAPAAAAAVVTSQVLDHRKAGYFPFAVVVVEPGHLVLVLVGLVQNSWAFAAAGLPRTGWRASAPW